MHIQTILFSMVIVLTSQISHGYPRLTNLRQHCTINCTQEIIDLFDCQEVGNCPSKTHYIGKPICGCCDTCLPYLPDHSICLDGGVDVNTPLGRCRPGFWCDPKVGYCVEKN